jgi:hypothetical protein
MKKIPLSQNKYAIVDDNNFEELNKFKWFTRKDAKSGIYYASRTEKVDGIYKNVHMHRVVIGQPNGNGFDVDHIDGDGLNNTKSNLRKATRQENTRNRKLLKSNTTGYRGVSYRGDRKAFVARVNINKPIYLGYFKTAEEASKVYETYIKSNYGEFYKEINV